VFRDLADPGPIRVGDTYYVTGTGQGGFAVFSSKNLKDWTKAGDTGQGGCGQCWAPEFLAHKGKFYLAFTDGGSFTTSIAVSNVVTGPYKLVCTAGIPGIDGSLYVHSDGKVYCYYNPIKRGAIMACGEMSADLSKMTSTRDLFSGPVSGLNQKQPTVEAPTVVRVGGLLYMIYSFNATGPDYNLTFATSQNPLGPWKQSGKTLLPDDKQGHGHGSPLQTKSGKWVYVYHGSASVNNGRNLCVDQMKIGGGDVSIDYHPPGKPGKLSL
jgi:beta-xylosidase